MLKMLPSFDFNTAVAKATFKLSNEPIPRTFSIIVSFSVAAAVRCLSSLRRGMTGGGGWGWDARPAVAMQKWGKFAIQMSSNEKLKRSDMLPGQLTETRDETVPSAAALLEGPGEAHQREWAFHGEQ